MTTSSILSGSSPVRRSGLSTVARAARTLHPQSLLVGYVFLVAFCVRLLEAALGVGGALLLVAGAHLAVGIWGARLRATQTRDKRTDGPVLRAADPVVVPEAIDSRATRTRPLPIAALRTTPLGSTTPAPKATASNGALPPRPGQADGTRVSPPFPFPSVAWTPTTSPPSRRDRP